MKNQASAEILIESMQQDPASVSAIRALMLRNGVGGGGQLTARAVVTWMASQLASGRILVCEASVNAKIAAIADPAGNSGTTAAPGGTETTRPFPLAARSPKATQKSSPASEQSAFPADVQLAALAQVLKDAARSGAPFCEECLKAAQRG